MQTEAATLKHPRCSRLQGIAFIIAMVICFALAAAAATQCLGGKTSAGGVTVAHVSSALELDGVVGPASEKYCCGKDGMGVDKNVFTFPNNGHTKEEREKCKTTCETHPSCGYWQYGFMAGGCEGISQDEACTVASEKLCQTLETWGFKHRMYSKAVKKPKEGVRTASEKYCCGKDGMGADKNVFTFPNNGHTKEEREKCKTMCENYSSCGYWQYGFMAGGCEGISRDEACSLASSKQCQSLDTRGAKHRLYSKVAEKPKDGVGIASENYCCGKDGMGADKNVFTIPNNGHFNEERENCQMTCLKNPSCGYWTYGFMSGGCEGISKDETCMIASSDQCQNLDIRGKKHRLYWKVVNYSYHFSDVGN